MSKSQRPLMALVVDSQPGRRGLHAFHVAVCKAVAAQGGQAKFRWLENPTEERVAEALADMGTVDVVFHCGDLPESARRIDLHVRMGGGNTRNQSVVVVNPELTPMAIEQATAALLASLIAGATFIDAGIDAQRAIDAIGNPWLLSGNSEERTAILAIGLRNVPLDLADPTDVPSTDGGKILQFPGAQAPAPSRAVPGQERPGGLPAEPSHGLVGRDTELADLALTIDKHGEETPIAITGYPGIGKTTLACHYGRWAVGIGRYQQVVYSDLSGGAFVENVLFDLLSILRPNETPSLDSADIDEVLALLAETPTLIIWDGLDTLQADGAMPLPSSAFDELVSFAKRIAATNGSHLLICIDRPVRSNESSSSLPYASTWLGLEPLKQNDAVDLIGHCVPEADDADNAELAGRLAYMLGEHPLALSAMAPRLARVGIQATINDLAEMMPGLAQGEGRLSNEAPIAAIALFLKGLPDDVGTALYPLGLLSRGFMQALALKLIGIDEDAWQVAQRPLTQAGLLTEEPFAGFTVPYVRLHPLLTDFLRRRLPTDAQDAAASGYMTGYQGLLHWLAQNKGRMPERMADLFRRELPNFRQVLRQILAIPDLVNAVPYVRTMRILLDDNGYISERDDLARVLQKATLQAVPDKGPLSRPGVTFMLSQIDTLIQSRRLPQAAALAQQITQRVSQENSLAYSGDAANHDLGILWHRMAQIAASARQPGPSYAALQRSLQAFDAIQDSTVARADRLALYLDLADTLFIAGKLDEFETRIHRAIDLATELGDPISLGRAYSKQSEVARLQGNLPLAIEHTVLAARSFEAGEDHLRTSVAYDQMGSLTLQTGDREAAEEHFVTSMAEAQRAGDAVAEANARVRLAHLMDTSGRSGQAEENLLKAIGAYQEQRMPELYISTEVALADLLLRLERLEDAHLHAQAARALAETAAPDGQHWQIYSLLTRITEAQGREDQRLNWRDQTRSAFRQSPEAAAVRSQWKSLIQSISTSCRGSAIEAETIDAVEKLEATPQWASLSGAIWRILGGERDRAAFEDLDHFDMVIIEAILDAIEAPEPVEEEDESEAPR